MTKKMMFTLMTLLMISTSLSFAQGLGGDYKTNLGLTKAKPKSSLFGAGSENGGLEFNSSYIGLGYNPSYTREIKNTYKIYEDASYSNECIQKRLGESCTDGINRFDAFLSVQDAAFAIYDTSPAACFGKKNDKCDNTPNIRKICGCLAAQDVVEKSTKLSSAEQTDEEFLGTHAQIINNAVNDEASKRMQILKEKFQASKCDDANYRQKPNIQFNCDKLEFEMKQTMLQAKKAKTHKDAGLGGAVGAVAGETSQASVAQTAQNKNGSAAPQTNSQEPSDIAALERNCMAFEDFNKKYEVPTKEVRRFFDEENANDSQGRARAIIVMSMLKGEAIFESSVNESTIDQYLHAMGLSKKSDEKQKIQKEITTLLKSPTYSAAKTDLKTFASNNAYWGELLAKDPKGAIQDFQGIYHRRGPVEMIKGIHDLNTRKDVVEAQDAAAKKNSDLLFKIYNKENGLMKKNAFRLYSDFDLVNMKMELENPEKLSPMFCAMTAKMLDSRRAVENNDQHSSSRQYRNIFNADMSDINQKTIDGCKSTFQDICPRIGTRDEFNAAPMLSPEDKDDLRQGIDYIVGKANALRDRVKSYKDFHQKVCLDLDKHKMASSYGFGNKKINRSEFKKELCEKKSRKLVRAIPEGVTLEKVCEDSLEGDTYLTSMFTNGLDSESDIDLDARVSTNKATNADSRKEKEEENKIAEYVASNTSSGPSADYEDDKECGFICSLRKSENKIANGVKASSATGTPAPTTTGSGPSFGEQFASGLGKAAETISQPAIDNNLQSYLNGNIPASNILPASFANADAAQISGAKSSVDNSISNLEKKIDAYEKSSSKSAASSAQNEELELLRMQIAELKQQSESLKAQLDKEKENKVAAKTDEQGSNSNTGRSIASVGDHKSVAPQVSGATQSLQNPAFSPSKVYDNMFADGSFHSVPTIGSSKSIDSKAFTSRSSNDALLSIYTDKGVSNLVDAVASNSNSNILVVGNALEMQETTVKDKKFQTKELMVDQKRLEMIRSNPESLRSLIEENKIKNHVGILTLKNGENQLNYIMRKDDAGKVVILPLNIARRVTLDSLKNELIRN